VNNLTVENQNLRAQLESVTTRKRDEPSTVNTAKSPAKPANASGNRVVTWADERSVPLTTAVPHLSQAHLKGFRRTNSAPAPPFLIQRAPNNIPKDIPTNSTGITPSVVSTKDYSHLAHFSQKNPAVWNNNNPMVSDPSRNAQYKYKRAPEQQKKVEPVVAQKEEEKKRSGACTCVEC
jgi:hypothetical protein